MRTSTLLSLLLIVAIVTTPSLALRGKLQFDFMRPDGRETKPSDDNSVSDTLTITTPTPTPTSSLSSSSAPLPITPVTPPYNPLQQLNLSWPYSPDTCSNNPSCPYTSPTTIRLLDNTYYIINNNTAAGGDYAVTRLSTSAVEENLERIVGDDAWERQEKVLKKYMKHVNRRYSAADVATCSTSVNGSCAFGGQRSDSDKSGHSHHGKGGKGGSGNQLTKFYLRHAQCGACTQYNSWAVSPSTSSPFPSYQPVAVMKWCTLSTPKLSSELPPTLSGTPLADWEGVCIPAEDTCPTATVDMNVLSPSTCARDEPATKQSCSLCVLDGYHWTTSQRAVNNADNYDGQCYSTPSYTYNSRSKHSSVVVSSLDECPSVVASVDSMAAYRSLAASFATFIFFTAAMVCCLCMRACCNARKARLARQSSGSVQVSLRSIAVPAAMSVPSVSSSPSPSAPPAAGYPAAVAVAHEYSQPLLSSSGLNPPRLSAYPQLQSYRM